MTQERENTKEALQTAIQMEIDGKEFYLNAAKAARNPLGQKLLNQLANEEDIHRKVFEHIFEELSQEKGWPETNVGHSKKIHTILSEAKQEVGWSDAGIKEEIDAVKTAMELENKTYDFYMKRAAGAAYPTEKEFFAALAVQEEEHHKVLLSYYEYLKDPEAWFVQAEHPSLDGG